MLHYNVPRKIFDWKPVILGLNAKPNPNVLNGGTEQCLFKWNWIMLLVWQHKKDKQRLLATMYHSPLGNSFVSRPTASAVHNSLNRSERILHCSPRHHLSSLTVVQRSSPQPKQTEFLTKVCLLGISCSLTVGLRLRKVCSSCSQLWFTAVTVDSNVNPVMAHHVLTPKRLLQAVPQHTYLPFICRLKKHIAAMSETMFNPNPNKTIITI